HNIGCGYGDPGSGRYAPDTLRNDTTAADLSAIWLGVLDGSLLPVGSLGRTEFLESGNPATGADAELQAIIDQEAAALGLGASDAAAFGARVRTWSKGGKYYTCLGDPANPTECGQKVSIRSTAGLLSLPIGGGRYSRIRNHAFASLMSDVPVPARDSPEDQLFVATRRAAHYEMFRSAVRSALLEW
ncbi:MAG TPA: hypothetical protein PLF63_06650, partial [Rubrivivax sp.]|nr:hypothetical protein [Rubrivivax sp.]